MFAFVLAPSGLTLSRRAAVAGGASLVWHTPWPALAEEEPAAARKLLALVEGRRAQQWRAEERPEVDALIEEVVALQAPWTREDLRGKWKLAYLQPGPDGTGVDRRIPFPELPWNDSYQVFGADSVVNIGELAGPALEVRVSGGLSEDDPSDLTAPKRFRADITEGQLCLAGPLPAACAPLPIKGEGLFDGVYLGKRLRIGKNLNGGGARIVQVDYTPSIVEALEAAFAGSIGVDASQVELTVSSGSVLLTFTTTTYSTDEAAAVEAAVVTSMGTAANASSVLDIVVTSAPVVVVTAAVPATDDDDEGAPVVGVAGPVDESDTTVEASSGDLSLTAKAASSDGGGGDAGLGAIIGGCVGAVLLLLLLCSCWLFRHRLCCVQVFSRRGSHLASGGAAAPGTPPPVGPGRCRPAPDQQWTSPRLVAGRDQPRDDSHRQWDVGPKAQVV